MNLIFKKVVFFVALIFVLSCAGAEQPAKEKRTFFSWVFDLADSLVQKELPDVDEKWLRDEF